MYSLKIIYENIYLNVSYDFLKFDDLKKINVFLMIPKDGLAQLLYLQK
jgi:hypothetical protein